MTSHAGEIAPALRSPAVGYSAGVVTLLFTDLVGSTELLQRLGDDAAEGLRRVHFSLVRGLVTSIAALRAAQETGQASIDVPSNLYFYLAIHPEER